MDVGDGDPLFPASPLSKADFRTVEQRTVGEYCVMIFTREIVVVMVVVVGMVVVMVVVMVATMDLVMALVVVNQSLGAIKGCEQSDEDCTDGCHSIIRGLSGVRNESNEIARANRIISCSQDKIASVSTFMLSKMVLFSVVYGLHLSIISSSPTFLLHTFSICLPKPQSPKASKSFESYRIRVSWV